jgi:hypothetical protein
MSEILFEGVKPADVTVFASKLAALETDPLTAILPNRNITGFRSRSTKVSRTTTAAKFRSFDAETPIGKRPVAATVQSVELAPLGQKLPLREMEILTKYLADQTNELAPVVQAIYDDTENNVSSIKNRALQLRGEFLFSGAISIEENGFIQEADYGLPAGHDLSVGDLEAPWDNGGDALSDELAWIERVQEASGETVVALVTSSKVARSLQTNAAYVQASGTVASRITPAEVRSVREAYDLPPLVICDAKVGGVRVTPVDKVALVTSTVGEFQWGDTVEGLELIGSKAVEEAFETNPKIVASAWKTTDPVNIWSKANATGLVVAGDINGLLVAEVLVGSVES